MSIEDAIRDTERQQLEAPHKTKRMFQEIRKYKPTEPFHSLKKCEDPSTCVWHEGRK